MTGARHRERSARCGLRYLCLHEVCHDLALASLKIEKERLREERVLRSGMGLPGLEEHSLEIGDALLRHPQIVVAPDHRITSTMPRERFSRSMAYVASKSRKTS